MRRPITQKKGEGRMNPTDLPYGERRLNHRKSCSRLIQVNDGNGSFKGHLRDLAAGGAFIEPDTGLSAGIGKVLHLNIPFGLQKGFLTVKAKVAWAKPQGMGVRFIAPQTEE